ncbi:MAG: hypothetical protein A2V93_00850 [Ignavibacteria bacterium RBG_16_34_14]|nr:MAG: hypothetical protein A2V93_00850 [Ignavibacteria bacterium RBG_16_34_14]
MIEKINFTLVVLFFLFSLENIKADSTLVGPSFYYTYGDYNFGSESQSFAFYNTLQLSNNLYLINHYENLSIHNKNWDYLQQAFLVGVIAEALPFYFKFTYSHYKGDFTFLPLPFEAADFTNLYSLDVIYYIDDFYFGASYTHLNQIGYKKQIADQFTFRLDKILSYDFFISIKPSYTKLYDGRNLFSAALRIHYLISPEILLKVGGFAGERAYYFDTDLLTIFNQDDTQKYQLFVQTDLSPKEDFKFILAYQHTKFTSFKIDYYIAGVRAALFL